ncbi:MAG TPA: class I SAM-dependent methyltransferase [Bacteroidales bacterium]|nr:class I SAM-dependent methyltransferase [Bacteroidales bacterium]
MNKYVQYPSNFARFYDTIYHQIRDSADSEYFVNEIVKNGGRVLEVGVGTGRLFENALKAGADIYGIDISESMLSVLYQKLSENEHFRVSHQNIVDFTINKKFDLVVAPFRVFMHLIEKEDQIKALNNIFDHLNENGRFIFDVFVPDLKLLLNGLDNVMDFEGEYEPGKKVRRFSSSKPDIINQILNVSFNMEWEEKDGLKHDYWEFQMRFFFRYELEHLIERSRFRKYEFFGDYNKNRLNKDSREFVVNCYK